MARALLTEEAKNDIRGLIKLDDQVALEGIGISKRLEDEPYLGERLREKSNLKPLAQAECRKVKFDRADRPATAKPRYRYRLLYRIEPHDGSPETAVVMAIGIKPRIYRDAATRAAQRLREHAHERRTQD